MTDNSQLDASTPKDEHVMSFMKQMVKEKRKSGILQDQIDEEANKLYYKFSENLISYFRPFISEEKKKELDNLISQSGDKDIVLAFLMESIDNFEQKILRVLLDFRNSYLKN